MDSNFNKSGIYQLCAADIMTEKVETVNQSTTIGQISHIMLRVRISGYPIVDDGGEIVGIVTLTDLYQVLNQIMDKCSAAADGSRESDLGYHIKQFKDKPVSDIMSENVIAINPATKVSEIIETVVKSNIHTFPVLDGSKIVGIIGRHDVLNAAFIYG